MEETKTCTKCDEDKSLSEFHLKRGKPRSICKNCCSLDYKTRYPRERERERTIEKHGITAVEYLKILSEQFGRCAICGKVPEETYNLYIDHDHECCPGQFSCGKCIRGLLCQKCNTGLGMFNDNLKNLQSAVTYLSGDKDGR